MKKILRYITVILVLFLPISVFATAGKLQSASIVSCNGVYYGKHGDGHWHVAVKRSNGWYPSGGALSYNNPCNIGNDSYTSYTPVIAKSNISTAKFIYNDEYISFKGNSSEVIKTDYSYLNLKIELDDDKATSDLKSSYKLNEGNNSIKVTVTAEDESKTTYTIHAYKLSSNANAIIKYNDETIQFDNDNNNITEVTTSKNTINFSVATESTLATTNLKNSYSLDDGTNAIKIEVTAENGDTKLYTINVKKNIKKSNFFELLLWLLVIVFVIVLVNKNYRNKLKMLLLKFKEKVVK